MPVDYRSSSAHVSQREAFARSFLARTYRRLLDRAVLGASGTPAALVDIGAGEGILLERIQRTGSPIVLVAVDRHPQNARICLAQGVPAVEGDAASLPLARARFDVALLTNMLEHVEDPVCVLREAKRVLCPGGRIIVLVPHEGNFRRVRLLLGRRREAHLDYGHVQRWDPGRLETVLARAGLRAVCRRNLPLPFWPLALHHLVVAVPDAPGPVGHSPLFSSD